MPLSSPVLLPGPNLFPAGPPGPFTSQLLATISPWNDPAGVWEAYNAAIGAMFEDVFDVVADFGDPNTTQVGSLSDALSTASAITLLPTTALFDSIEAGSRVVTTSGTNAQTWTAPSGAAVGATSIPVVSAVPNFPYPAGTPVSKAWTPGWSTLLDPLNCPDRFLPYLAQFVGAAVTPQMIPSVARRLIDNDTGAFCNCGNMARGTVVALRTAVKRNLVGTQSVFVLERTGLSGPDPYAINVVLRPEEVLDLQAVKDAVNLVKPGGILVFYVLTDGFTWNQAVNLWSGDVFSWDASAHMQP